MRTVAVIGLGAVGAGLAQLCAAGGFETIVRDRDAHHLWEGLARIDRALANLVGQGCMTAQAKRALQERFIPVQNVWMGLDRADVVIEAIDEDREAKLALWRQLGEHASPQAVFATTSARIPVDDLTAALPGPDRMLGLRFVAPVTILDLVEVIKSEQTCAEACEQAISFVVQLGKTPRFAGQAAKASRSALLSTP